MLIRNINSQNKEYYPTKTNVIPKKENEHTQVKGDDLSISMEAMDLLINKEEEKIKLPNKMQEYYRELKQGLDDVNEAAEGTGDAYKELAQCIKIAMRIVGGDTVPIQDQQFLAEKHPELYSMAMNMKLLKEDPENWDSELDEEENGPFVSQELGAEITPPAATVSPGGEVSAEGQATTN